MGYAVKTNTMLCLDMGHFHPTESISDKISSILLYIDKLLFHVSRGVRWDSDHVVILSDELRAFAQELVRGNYLDRTMIALDFFDASINRVAAWTTGVRATLKALLLALLEPTKMLLDAEKAGDYTARLALSEEVKGLPFGAVWNYHCAEKGVAPDFGWLDIVRAYEKDVLSKRG
jgi:L-rhamnose isomerase